MIRKNISRKVTAVAVSMVLSVMSCMMVSADYVYEIGWSEDPCPRCGAGIWISEVYGNTEKTSESRVCWHYTEGEDVQMVQHGSREFECQECGFGWDYSISNYYWECEGYGSPRNN